MANLDRKLESGFRSERVAVVTTTFYPKWYEGEVREDNLVDKVRGDLAIETAAASIEKGYQLVLVDGGSSNEFLSQLVQLKVNVSPEVARGMSPSRQQGFEEASALPNVKVIAWIEPEKSSYVEDCLDQVVSPIFNGQVDLVVPKRNTELFQARYPDYQVEFEARSNHLWNERLRKTGLRLEDDPDLDVWFGPKAFRKDVVNLFTSQYSFDSDSAFNHHKIIRPDLWPNAIFLPVIAALHGGLRVASVEVPYLHPQEQTRVEADSDEFRRKREIQQRNIILTSKYFIRMLKGDEDTGLRKVA